jgi:hypothetical protein
MFSSPVCDLAPELQTSEIPEGFMKHPVLYSAEYEVSLLCGFLNLGFTVTTLRKLAFFNKFLRLYKGFDF